MEHEFHLCWQFIREYEHLSCANSALQPIASAFIRNMNRVRGMGTLSLNLTTVAIVNEAARLEALVNKRIPLHDPRITYGHPDYDPELFSELNEERKRLIDEWEKAEPKFQVRMLKAGVQAMNVIIDENEAESKDAVQATMAAMLIGLRTAFESLAQDTWIAAVDARPDPLATRVLKRNSDLGTGTQPKTIPPDQIIGHGFDLRNAMGTILFRQRAIDFQQLKTIRGAYNVAFVGEFESIFEAFADELCFLEAERNLFVHKGGLVDQKFVQRMGNQSGMRETIGKSLAVNGRHVAHKANVVSRCSTQLIQAVDKWLIENHEPATQKPSDGDVDS